MSVLEVAGLQRAGFKAALDRVVRGRRRVVGVPAASVDGSRRHDVNWRRRIDGLLHLHRLCLDRFPTSARIASFLAVGATGLVVDVAFYLGLQGIGVEHRVARFVAFWPAVTWTWRLNRHFTFVDRPRTAPVMQWTRFVAGSMTGLAVNVGTYTALTTFVAAFDRHRLVALACGIVLASVVNYSSATLYAYRRTRPPSG
ncbi:MAG: GtrA family protein [Gammaproteobacteria bacterium]|nr:GtrA family protein [Gammaproteobacteria bacterium]